MTWSLLTPGDTDRVRQGDDAIREMKDDIEDALLVEHSFPVNSGAPVCYHAIPAGTTAARPAASAGTAGRWYYNTDTGTIQRDNGTSWDELTTISPFEAGTYVFFCQTTPPSGWTRSTAQDDRLLRVNSSAGGGTGGAWGVTIAAETFAHTHGGTTDSQNLDQADAHSILNAIDTGKTTGTGTIYDSTIGHTGSSHTHTIGSDNYTHGHTVASSWKPAYKDVIMATKD